MTVLAPLVLSVLALRVIVCLAGENYAFDKAPGSRIPTQVLETVPASHLIPCAMKCLASAQCMASNSEEGTGSCELLGAHAAPVPAPGYTALTRHCRVTPMGQEFLGGLSVTVNGRTCMRWDANCQPHCHSATFPAGAQPENYCRNPDAYSGGIWCYTTDPNVRWELCDVPLC